MTNLVDVRARRTTDRQGGRGGVRTPRGRLAAVVPSGRRRTPGPRGSPRERRTPRATAVISGIGQSDVGRRLGRTELDLTLDACLARPSPMPASPATTSTAWPPIPAVGSARAGSPARGPPRSRTRCACGSTGTTAGGEGPGQMRAVIAACFAVAAGPGPPRPRLPDRDRVDAPRGRAAARASVAAGAAAACPACLGLPAVDAPLRCRVGGQLAGPGRPAPMSTSSG